MLKCIALLGSLAVSWAYSVRGAYKEQFITSFEESDDPISFLEEQSARIYLNEFASKKATGQYHSVVASTQYGSVQGIDDGKVTQYLGVPFAKPPVGDLRLKSPVAPEPWGHIVADKWKPGCMQSSGPWTLFTGMDEDCLYMNFYLPSENVASPPPGGWPIMLFFYGGSWKFGAAGFPLYHGHFIIDSLLGTNHNVMIVSINYRLGPFGFLASEALRAESPDGSVGNYGLQDQRQAMKFLQEVATDFGGNPNLITIYGESAGSGSVSNHLVNPRSWGLFHRAIAQSGAMASEWVAQPFNVSTIKTDQLLRNARCDGKVTYAEELACLRSLTAIDFYYSSMNLPSGLLQWSPVIDGVELPAHPRQLMKQGKIAPNVPVILGSTRDEGTILLGVPYGVEPSDYYSTLEEYIGADLAPAVAAKYQLSDFPSTWWTLIHMLGDAVFVCPSRESAIRLSSRAPTTNLTAAYLYNFGRHWDLIQLYDSFGKKPLGVFHGSELLAVFNLFHALPFLAGPGEKEFCNLITRYWSRFAWTGNPNGLVSTTDPKWAQYNLYIDNSAYLDVVNGTAKLTMVNGHKKHYCNFWETQQISPETIFM